MPHYSRRVTVRHRDVTEFQQPMSHTRQALWHALAWHDMTGVWLVRDTRRNAMHCHDMLWSVTHRDMTGVWNKYVKQVAIYCTAITCRATHRVMTGVWTSTWHTSQCNALPWHVVSRIVTWLGLNKYVTHVDLQCTAMTGCSVSRIVTWLGFERVRDTRRFLQMQCNAITWRGVSRIMTWVRVEQVRDTRRNAMHRDMTGVFNESEGHVTVKCLASWHDRG